MESGADRIAKERATAAQVAHDRVRANEHAEAHTIVSRLPGLARATVATLEAAGSPDVVLVELVTLGKPKLFSREQFSRHITEHGGWYICKYRYSEGESSSELNIYLISTGEFVAGGSGPKPSGHHWPVPDTLTPEDHHYEIWREIYMKALALGRQHGLDTVPYHLFA